MILYSLKSSLRDEYKEFEKLIQEDLREVDDRLEEEEVDHYFLCAIYILHFFLPLSCACTANVLYDKILSL